jgi:predicted metalloprotease with PDZ domain
LTYEVTFTAGDNKADVIIHYDDPDNQMSMIYLSQHITGPFRIPEDYITNLECDAGSIEAGNWNVANVKEGKLLYSVNLEINYQDGGYASYASNDWIITSGGFLFIVNGGSGTYSYPEVFLRLNIPETWEAHVPYNEIEPGLYSATDFISHFVPDDHIVCGKPEVMSIATKEKTGFAAKTVVVGNSDHSAELISNTILDLATVYTKIAGCSPPTVFCIVAPEPMRRYGGEASEVSIFYSDDNPFPFDLSWGSSTYAHELFHLYQTYYTLSGHTWIKEGIPSYYQFYSFLKQGDITPSEFWDVFVNVLSNRADKKAVLSSDQDYYIKGSLVVLALDISLRIDTNGKYCFDDIYKRINQNYIQEYITANTIKDTIYVITGLDYTDFFNKYINSSDYPQEIFDTYQSPYLEYLEALQ